MAYLLDAAVILILALFVWLGCRRGLARAAVILVGCIVAMVASSFLSRPAAEWTFDRFLADRAEQVVKVQLQGENSTQLREEVRGALESMPQSLRRFMELCDMKTPEELADEVMASWADSQGNLATQVVQVAIRPTSVTLMTAAFFLVITLLLMIVVRLVASLIDQVFRLPVLRQLNKIGGALVGAAQGVLMVVLLVLLVEVVCYCVTTPITPEVIDQTYLFSFFSRHLPVLG